jgi:Rod binding domain-containing protein
MFDKEVSVQMSKRNSVGLADMLVKAQGRHMDAVNNANHALNPGQGAGTAASGSASAGLPLNVPAPSLSLEHVDHPLKKMVAPGSPMTLRRVQSSYGSSQAGDSP